MKSRQKSNVRVFNCNQLVITDLKRNRSIIEAKLSNWIYVFRLHDLCFLGVSYGILNGLVYNMRVTRFSYINRYFKQITF